MSYRRTVAVFHLSALLVWLIAGCWQSSQSGGGASSGTDADGDTDADGGPEQPPACVVYVDADAPLGGDGSSWESALVKVQQGIDRAAEMLDEHGVCHVWVASGLYRIYQDSVDDTVELRAGVQVYGGFAGGETLLAERNWKQNVCELNGLEHLDSSATVCHVVTGANDAVLDGFVIRDGACL